jgi:hypothetical protein
MDGAVAKEDSLSLLVEGIQANKAWFASDNGW